MSHPLKSIFGDVTEMSGDENLPFKNIAQNAQLALDTGQVG
jgi:hypothetical protein